MVPTLETLLKMIEYTTSKSTEDLRGILDLQQKNLRTRLSQVEAVKLGFVYLQHDLQTLKDFNCIEEHVIAKNEKTVIGYVLTMTKKSRFDIPEILPMFEIFDHLEFSGKPISTYNYMVVGQVCIDLAYRGKGLFHNLYAKYREQYASKYDFTITEIPKINMRSRRAHNKIGFKEVYEYTDSKKVEWVVVLWDWKNPSKNEILPRI